MNIQVNPMLNEQVSPTACDRDTPATYDTHCQICVICASRHVRLILTKASEIATSAAIRWVKITITPAQFYTTLLNIGYKCDRSIRNITDGFAAPDTPLSNLSCSLPESGIYIYLSEKMAELLFEKPFRNGSPLQFSEEELSQAVPLLKQTTLNGFGKQILRELACGTEPYQKTDMYRSAKFSELLCLLSETLPFHDDAASLSVKLSERDIRALTGLKEFLHHPPSGALTLFELASRFGINRNKLAHGFKHLFGISVMAYRRKIQLAKAVELLHDQDKQISEIADEVGFQHPCNFSTAFREEFGCSPKDLRKSLIGRRITHNNNAESQI